MPLNHPVALVLSAVSQGLSWVSPIMNWPRGQWLIVEDKSVAGPLGRYPVWSGQS